MKYIPIIFVIVSVLLSGCVAEQASSVDIEEKTTNETLECDNSFLSSASINVIEYNRTDEEFNGKIEYLFELEEFEQPKYMVDSVDSYESIKNITNSGGTLRVVTSFKKSISSQFQNNRLGHITPFRPTLELSVIENTGRTKLKIGTQRYPQYSNCISNSSVIGDHNMYATQNNMIIHPDIITTDPYVFSNSTQPSLFAYGNIDQKTLTEIKTVFSQTSKYVNMTATNRINLHITPELDPTGLARYRTQKSAEVFIGGNDFSKYVLTHEIAHTTQKFFTTAETRWFVEGSAEYLSGVFLSEIGLEKQAQKKILNPKFSARTSDINMSLTNQTTWVENIQYNRGAKLSYKIDMAIREHTRDKNILHFITTLNRYSGVVNQTEFKNILGDMAGDKFVGEYYSLVNQQTPINITNEFNAKDININTKEEHEMDITKCSSETSFVPHNCS